MTEPRAVLFTDTFDEPNGVATISQQFLRCAHTRGLPLLLIRPSARLQCTSSGSTRVVELPQSWLSLPLDTGLKFDFLAPRHLSMLRRELEAFGPDVVHVTGPGHVGMLGAWLAHQLSIPLVMSWHTNLHQYANLRCQKYLRFLPQCWTQPVELKIERYALLAAARFYQVADLLLAPNEEILATLTKLTGRSGRLLPHGVDCDRFQPTCGNMPDTSPNRPFTIGYVGRLTSEKSVHALADLEAVLLESGMSNVRFLVVGEGSQRAPLARRMRRAVFCGILRDEALREAYSQMDLFVFPSRSDTLGLVLLEAMAAGVPTIAFRTSGPGTVIRDGCTGFLVETVSEVASLVQRLAVDCCLRHRLSDAARLQALGFTWDLVFETCYDAYAAAREAHAERRIRREQQLIRKD